MEDTAVPVLDAQIRAATLASTQEIVLHAICTPSVRIPESAAAASFPPVARMSRPNFMFLKNTARNRTKMIIITNNPDVGPTLLLPRAVNPCVSLYA